MKRSAPAKINLTLHVGAAQPSGYHDIDTLFQMIELSDLVSVALVHGGGDPTRGSLPRIELATRGHEVGPTEQNLVYRAAEAYLAALPDAARSDLRAGLSLRIELEKNIPPGTGLGGGSSDAATTLLALDELLGTERSQQRLLRIAAGLGSDVPFFLCGSALARGEGRGEILTTLVPLPSLPVVVALPAVHVSTAEAYRALDRSRGGGEGPGAASEAGANPARRPSAPPPSFVEPTTWASVAQIAANDFEEVVFHDHPQVAEAHRALSATSPLLARMSGSGSAVFAVYETDEQAQRALQGLTRHVPESCRLIRTRTLTEPPIR